MQTIILTPSANSLSGYSTSEIILCLCDTTDASFEISLPDAQGIENNVFVFKKISSGTNTVTLSARYGQSIDSLETFEITDQNEAITLMAHDSNYYITGYYAG
jgi:hypothetical protein